MNAAELPNFIKGDSVQHPRHGAGIIQMAEELTAIVRFSHGLEECLKSDLRPQPTVLPKGAETAKKWDVPLEVLNRIQAEAILSVNNTWGIFTRSRIELLPHQLWVCRQVHQDWPMRWLIADDVGLGKTIEAGMILTSLLSSGKLKRLLVICPASLVAQWQNRLLRMFDIRLAIYSPESDTQETGFWQVHDQVVASMQTLRLGSGGRKARLLESDPWDLVIVDEAHHLNVDEKTGATLGYRLIEEMEKNQRIRSMLFFTATPHRGKSFGFLSLLELLRSDLFNASLGLDGQVSSLREVMIRNNKSNVTDLQGNRLFQQPLVRSETYTYTDAEQHFYEMLSDFILRGRAYASRLSLADRRMVMLVLIAMQKLASSSVAAIRRAVNNRLRHMRETRQRLNQLKKQVERYSELEGEDAPEASDAISQIEEDIAGLQSELRLVENEEHALHALLAAAEEIQRETKILKILDAVEQHFQGRSVLFFTEYKATQALLLSELIQRYGLESMTFINGDERVDDLRMPDGKKQTIRKQRAQAAADFNAGRVRFLVSTEAAGEGIDLQESCHTLIHVDLPWNPMRLHQRVGRLNRYGQKHRVEVLIVRNPDTVESRIWDQLEAKLREINRAFRKVMDAPEDMEEIVLGATTPAFFQNLFSDGLLQKKESLETWFNERAKTFGGEDAVDTVRALIGSVNQFDFRNISSRLPQVDLPDLQSFFEGALVLNNRRLNKSDAGISFITPDVWRTEPAIRIKYEGLVFDRKTSSARDATCLVGVGHKALDKALEQGRQRMSSRATLPQNSWKNPLFAFRVFDRVTDGKPKPSVILGVEVFPDGQECEVLLDWRLLLRLNTISLRGEFMRCESDAPEDANSFLEQSAAQAAGFLLAHLADLDLGFRVPKHELLAVLWPHKSQHQ